MFGMSGTGCKALRASALVAAGVAFIVTAGCGSSSSKTTGSGPSRAPSSSPGSGPSRAPSSSPTASAEPVSFAPPSSPGQGKKFYVSIGDSYGAGYQPASNGKGLGTFGAGYANQLPALVESQNYHLTLVNFACSGATTTSLISTRSCPYAGEQGPGQVSYPTQTQAQAATAFVAAHRSEVGLITVSISGNDITACARQANLTAAGVAGCLTKALVTVKTNLGSFLKQLHAAAGPDVPIIGLTYPDVVLGSYVSPKPSTRSLAALSVTAFKALINPALKAQYDAVNGIFVDITAATGAYTPFTQTTTLAPYGTIPVAVAKVCELTFYCQLTNIHPRTVGYTFIAHQIAAALPPR